MLDYLNTASVTAMQPIFTGGRIFNGNKLAKTGTEIYSENQTLTTTEVLVKTEELYWTIISLSEKTKTIESFKNLLDTLNRNVSVAYKAGLVQRTDLLKVQLKMNEIEVNKMKLNNGISLAKHALCQHIGIHYDSSLVLNGKMLDSELLLLANSDPTAAIKNRSEYKMLEKAIKVEELQKKMIVGENLPQVAVGVTGFYLDVMDNHSTNAMALATVSIPISDWWGGSHKIKQSKAKIETARNKLNETSELLALQVQQANNELNEYYFQISIAKKSVEQAQENLKVTNDNYKAGISSMSDLLEAQSVYQGALDSLTEARCNYQIKKARYQQAIGSYK
jgi:outer membrane protein TolC